MNFPMTLLNVPYTVYVTNDRSLMYDAYEMRIILRNNITGRKWYSTIMVDRFELASVGNVNELLETKVQDLIALLKRAMKPYVVREFLRREHKKNQLHNTPYIKGDRI